MRLAVILFCAFSTLFSLGSLAYVTADFIKEKRRATESKRAQSDAESAEEG